MPANLIRVASSGEKYKYVLYAKSLIEKDQFEEITIASSGRAISKAVKVAEILTDVFPELHQQNMIFSKQIKTEVKCIQDLSEDIGRVDEYETLVCMSIKLSKVELKNNIPGY